MTNATHIEDAELKALISLLDEPNRQMYGKISEKLLTYGLGIIPVLENKWDNCFDEVIQERIENIIHHIQFENIKTELFDWSNSFNHNLLDGYFLITKYMYPELQKEDVMKAIDLIRTDLNNELNDNLTALEKVKVINHVIFDIHAFRANRRRIQSAQNHLLINLLDTKKGSNLSLGILYLIAAQSVELPIYGIDLPRHFILAYTKRAKRKNDECVPVDDVLFFINPFTGGSVITREDVELSVKQMKLNVDPSLFCPCSEIRVIKRVLKDLIIYFDDQHFPDKVEELNILLEILPA